MMWNTLVPVCMDHPGNRNGLVFWRRALVSTGNGCSRKQYGLVDGVRGHRQLMERILVSRASSCWQRD